MLRSAMLNSTAACGRIRDDFLSTHELLVPTHPVVLPLEFTTALHPPVSPFQLQACAALLCALLLLIDSSGRIAASRRRRAKENRDRAREAASTAFHLQVTETMHQLSLLHEAEVRASVADECSGRAYPTCAIALAEPCRAALCMVCTANALDVGWFPDG
jgi:hypothetical protein